MPDGAPPAVRQQMVKRGGRRKNAAERLGQLARHRVARKEDLYAGLVSEKLDSHVERLGADVETTQRARYLRRCVRAVLRLDYACLPWRWLS